MSINLTMPETTELKPRITVVGVGGAGGNAVNNMIGAHLEGVEFVVTNTDAQALSQSLTERRVQLGVTVTQGLGAGSRPEVGHAAAHEALDEIMDHIQGSHMVFITAGMGGGTGTGAAPVVAQAARAAGMLTVGVVTKPFHFEGNHRMAIAEAGMEELQNHVDTLIIIPNQNLFRVANEKTTFADAFKMADDVLYSGVRGVTDLMVMPGLINLDFADVRAVMGEMGKAMMGTGEAEGEKRATDAAEAAIANPLLDDVSMKGAHGVLINITGGMDMTLYEVDEAANRIREEVDDNANIIFGSTFDEALEGTMRVSIVATGIEAEGLAGNPLPKLQVVGGADSVDRTAASEVPAAAMSQPMMGQPALDLGGAPSASLGTPAPSASMGGQAQALAMPEPEMAEDYKPMVPSALSPPISQPAMPTPTPRPEPKAEAPSAKAEPELKVPKAERDSFIARPAMTPGVGETRTAPRPEPFSEAALTNGAAPEKKVSRGPSLLERMTGTGRARQKETAPEIPEATPSVPEPASDAVEKAPADPDPALTLGESMEADEKSASPASEAPETPAAPKSEAKKPAPTPEIDPADRLAPPPEEDILEIPAFLRRQAN